MVNLQKIDDSSVKFVFTDSDHYLVGNGEIVVPINSLSLVIDDSEMVTFKKASTGDPFISFRADNSNLGTKEAIEEFYKENMVGAGGGISEEEVQDMIDSATSGIPSSQVVEQLRTDVNTISANTYTKTQIDGFLSNSEGILTTISGDVQTNAANIRDINDTIDDKEEVIASALTEVRQDVADIDAKEEVIASALTEVRQNVDTLSGDVQTKVATSDFNAYSAATATAIGNKQDALQYYTEDTSRESATIKVQNDDGAGNLTENRVFVGSGYTFFENHNETDDGEGNTGVTDTQVDMSSLGLFISAYSEDGKNESETVLNVQPMGAYINSEPIATEPYVDAALSGKADTSAVTAVNGALTTHTANTTVHVSQAEKATWNAKADASAITSIESAVTAVSNDLNTLSGAVIDNEYTVSQSLNDLNSRKLDASAYTPTDLSQYWTSAQTQSAIDDAKAYYVDFAAMSVQGITDADWDGLVAAINAHRPILVKVGTANGYVNTTSAGIFDNNIIVTGADEGNASQYIFTKNGSNDYSVSTSTKKFVTQTEKDAWNAKQDALTAGSGIEISGNVISAIGGGSVTVDPTLNTGSTNPVANSAITTAINAKANKTAAFGSYSFGSVSNVDKLQYKNINGDYIGNEIYFPKINGKGILTSNGIYASNNYNFQLVETSAITTSMTSSSTDAQVPSAKAVYDALGGLKLVKISQADYDVLATKDNDTLYIIPDADGGSSDWPE